MGCPILPILPHPSLRSSPPLHRMGGELGGSALRPSSISALRPVMRQVDEGRGGVCFTEGTPPKNFTKIVPKNGANGIGACGGFKRRTRSWSTPHAEMAISPRGVHYSRRRKSAEKYAEFNRETQGNCTFFTRRWKFRLRKPLILGQNAI